MQIEKKMFEGASGKLLEIHKNEHCEIIQMNGHILL